MDLIVKPEEKSVKTEFSEDALKDQPKEVIRYKVPKVKLSENIQAFDERPRVYTQNPYEYNSVSLRKDVEYTPTASEMIADPLYNKTAKALGVDTVHDWNLFYDKVAKIVDWAKQETNLTDINDLVNFIYQQSSIAPTMGGRKIDDLYMYFKLKVNK